MWAQETISLTLVCSPHLVWREKLISSCLLDSGPHRQTKRRGQEVILARKWVNCNVHSCGNAKCFILFSNERILCRALLLDGGYYSPLAFYRLSDWLKKFITSLFNLRSSSYTRRHWQRLSMAAQMCPSEESIRSNRCFSGELMPQMCATLQRKQVIQTL